MQLIVHSNVKLIDKKPIKIGVLSTRRKGKIEEITLQESTKGREERLSSFFFLTASDYPFPVYA